MCTKAADWYDHNLFQMQMTTDWKPINISLQQLFYGKGSSHIMMPKTCKIPSSTPVTMLAVIVD